MALGAEFDEVDADGGLARAREGGHSVARVVHAGGDATGAEIERALVAAVQAVGRRRARGMARHRPPRGGRPRGRRSSPSGPTAPRRAARRAHGDRDRRGGAVLRGHHQPGACRPATASRWRCGPAWRSPTSSSCSSTRPRCTIRRCRARCSPRRCAARARSCATSRARRSWRDEHPLADLAPRDVVARAISRRLNERGLDHLWLDATGDRRVPGAVPHDLGGLPRVGLDPTRDWLPVAPAAHYLSGGVCTDLDGATTLPGLWACGEAACPACTARTGWRRTRCSRAWCSRRAPSRRSCRARRTRRTHRCARATRPRNRRAADVAPLALAPAGAPIREELQRIMTRDAGVVRSADEPRRAPSTRSRVAGADRRREREPSRGEHRAGPRGHGAPRIARHAHPRRSSGVVARVPRSLRVHGRRRRPSSSAPGDANTSHRDELRIDAPVHVVRARRRARAGGRPRPARRPHRRARARRRARRPSTSSPGPTASSRALRARPRCSRSSTRSVQVRLAGRRRRAGRPGHQGR